MNNKFFILTFLCLMFLGAVDEKFASLLSANDSIKVIEFPSEIMPEETQIRKYSEIYPAELHLGDPIYIVTYVENLSDHDIKVWPNYLTPYNNVAYDRYSVFSDGIDGDYFWITESPVPTSAYRYHPPRWLKPGCKAIDSCAVLEFPPLEDWNKPFWTNLKEKMLANGEVSCTLRVNFTNAKERTVQNEADVETPTESTPRLDVDESLVRDVSLKVMKSSTFFLDVWSQEIPEEFLPEDFPQNQTCFYKSSRDIDAMMKIMPQIKIGNSYLYYDNVVRAAFRKPPTTKFPSTIEKWRQLESFFSGSLKDEFTYIRMALEYYDAQEGKESDIALQKLLSWMKNLPFPQLYVMAKLQVLQIERHISPELPKESGLRPKRTRLHEELNSLIQTCEAHVND